MKGSRKGGRGAHFVGALVLRRRRQFQAVGGSSSRANSLMGHFAGRLICAEWEASASHFLTVGRNVGALATRPLCDQRRGQARLRNIWGRPSLCACVRVCGVCKRARVCLCVWDQNKLGEFYGQPYTCLFLLLHSTYVY